MSYLFVTSLKVTLFCLNYKYLNFMTVEFTSALNETERLETSNTNRISTFSTAYLIQDNQLDVLGQISLLSPHSCAIHMLVHLAWFTSNLQIREHIYSFSSLQILQLPLYSAHSACLLFVKLHLNFRGNIYKSLIPSFRYTWFNSG